jgi:5-methylcytosine-specific restriction endonuclease McrA
MQRTLVLSSSFEPLAAINWQKAIVLLTLGKVEIVETYDRDIRSAFLVIKMPAVVRLISYFRRGKRVVRFNRQNVLARDKWRCQYCGEKKPIKELTYDHVTPRSKGGKTEWANIVASCGSCNLKKGNRTPQEAGMRLLSKPKKPSWVPALFVPIKKGSVPEQWINYLYWNSPLDEG